MIDLSTLTIILLALFVVMSIGMGWLVDRYISLRGQVQNLKTELVGWEARAIALSDEAARLRLQLRKEQDRGRIPPAAP